MSSENSKHLNLKKFIPSKPVYEQSTLRDVYIYVTGACLRYLLEGQQLSTSAEFGDVMDKVSEYTEITYSKVVAYMRGEAKLDASYSDHQVTVAEQAKKYFPPVGEPLTPGNKEQDEVNDKAMLHQRIKHAIESIVAERYRKAASGRNSWTSCAVEFDMGTMQGPHAHKHPGFRVMLYIESVSYTHHFLIDKFTSKEDLYAYAEMMTGGDTSCIHVFGDEDVASHEALVAMYEATVIAQWRGKLAKAGVTI